MSGREMVHIVLKSPVAGSYERDSEASASLRCGEILDQVKNYHIVNKNFFSFSYSLEKGVKTLKT
jgi:hypothetical protein